MRQFVTTKISQLISSNKNIIILFTGTFIAQLVPLLFSPVLTRLFNPGDFGLFALYFSIIQVISVFISLRYEMAIILPEHDRNAINLVALSLLTNIIICVISIGPFVLFPEWIGILLNNQEFTEWAFTIPVAILVLGITQTLTYWSNRKERYREISESRISRSAGTTFFSILFAFLPLKQGGLILGDILGQGISSAYLVLRFIKFDVHLMKKINLAAIFEQAKRYKQFPKYNVGSGLLEKTAGHLPPFMLTTFFSLDIAGLFALGQRMVSAPSAILARSIGDVFRVEANREFLQTGTAVMIFKKTFIKLLAISVIPFGILFIFGPLLFSFFFGEDWREAGVYARLLAPMFFLQFVVSPLSNMFLVAEKQKLDLVIQIILLIMVAVAFAAGKLLYNEPRITLLLFAAIYCIKYVVEFYFSYRFSKGLQ